VMPAKHFVTQRRPERSNQAVDKCGDNGNLDAPRPIQFGQAGIVVCVYGFLLLL